VNFHHGATDNLFSIPLRAAAVTDSTGPSAPSSLSRADYRSLALLLAGMTAIGPFSIDTYLPSFLEIGARLGASPMEVQQTLTAYLIPFAIMTLWHGSISDALGRRRVVLVALAFFALASIGCATAGSIGALWFFRAMQGMTAGAGIVVGRAIIRDLFSGAEAHRLMAHVTIMFAVAPAVAPVIGGQLHAWFGWRSVFVFLTLFSAGLWTWCLLKLPETLDKSRRQPLHPGYLLRSYWKVLTHGAFVAACIAVSLNFGGFFVYVTSAPVFLLQHLKVKETEFLWLFGPATTGMMAGSWIASHFAGRLTHKQSIQRGFLVMTAAALSNVAVNLTIPGRLPWAVVPLFFYTLGVTMSMPSLTLLALDLFPDRRGMAASCQGFIQTATYSVIASLIAPIACVTTLRLASCQTILLGLGLAATLAYAGIHKSGKSKLNSPVEGSDEIEIMSPEG
jgi:DHA1 family bicyclomycin/chloramphenicol resistance-like MFS transporter